MHFTSGGIARKNGFTFEVKYSGFLNGVHQENPWYLYVSHLDPASGKGEGCYTEYSLRFSMEEDAKAFCERIADGDISLSQLKSAETAAYEQYLAKCEKDMERELDLYVAKLQSLGIAPSDVPDVYQLLSALSQNAQSKALNKEYLSRYTPEPVQEERETPFSNIFFEQRRDMDVCLLDRDRGDHFLPAICYLDPVDVAYGLCDYTAKEKWLLSLPLSHTAKETESPLAVLKTDFTHEQVEFLLGIPQFDSPEWAEQSIRAVYAGADFAKRLQYLKDGTSFEVLFDGEYMDAYDDQQRRDLCQLLSTHDAVYITTFPGTQDNFYAYSLEKGPHGRIITSELEVPIQYTDKGKGLTSTLLGKIHWAQHKGQRLNIEGQHQTAQAQEIRQEV